MKLDPYVLKSLKFNFVKFLKKKKKEKKNSAIETTFTFNLHVMSNSKRIFL